MTPLDTTGLSLGVVADHGGVGMGHVGRCLALIQVWVAAGGRARFHSDGDLPHAWADRIVQAGASIEPMPGDEIPDAAAWIIDGYRVPLELQTRLHRMAPLVVVDDHGAVGRYDADLVVDQNLGVDKARYERRAGTARLLIGPAYALLRQEVVQARLPKPPDRTVPPKRVLVALGGEPTDQLRQAVSPALRELTGMGLRVDRLDGLTDVGPTLRAADLALSAAGSTCWELCAFGIPAVVFAVADNQRLVARHLGAQGAATDAGDIESLHPTALMGRVQELLDDPDGRQKQSDVGLSLVDGLGAGRVLEALMSVIRQR